MISLIFSRGFPPGCFVVALAALDHDLDACLHVFEALEPTYNIRAYVGLTHEAEDFCACGP